MNKRLLTGGKLVLRDHDLIEVLPASKVGPIESVAFLFESLREEPQGERPRTLRQAIRRGFVRDLPGGFAQGDECPPLFA